MFKWVLRLVMITCLSLSVMAQSTGRTRARLPQEGNYQQLINITLDEVKLDNGNGIRLIRMVPPRMPASLMRSRTDGEGSVLLTVRADGRVRSAKIIRQDSLDIGDACLWAVRQWIFEPMGRELEVPVKFLFSPVPSRRH